MAKVIIIGSGGHAKVLADALICAGIDIFGFTSLCPLVQNHGSVLSKFNFLGDDNSLDKFNNKEMVLVNGIGGVDCLRLRQEVQIKLEKNGWRFIGVRHPTAVISQFADVESEVQLLAGSIVQPGSKVGRGCIINTGAIVEHDVALGEFIHVAPGATVCGNSIIQSNSHIGAGAIIRQGILLGSNTLVGAGAVVVKNFEGNGNLVGLPAIKNIS
jgi:sugar O-acyltransferase (sialic acid O-acetyltransferase NeuD family)